MKIGIMQPYFFPYIGYFQLVAAVDQFVFYDDVNFIKGGWIHRNRIIISNEANYISIPMIGASSFKKINEIKTGFNQLTQSKLLKTITHNYGKTPYFNDVMPIIIDVIEKSTQNLAEVAANSVITVANYLKLNTDFSYSSELEFGKTSANREDRLVEIINSYKIKTYINAYGGKALYNKSFFESNGIKLEFIKPYLTKYNQNSVQFIPGLSIIDVLMNNSIENVLILLNKFELE